MAHHITGIVARRDVLKSLDGPFAGQPCFALREIWAFMPLDRENLDGITGLHHEKAIGEFFYLTEQLIELLCLASRAGELAYIETDYFGGVGGQGAAAFRGAEMISAPDWRGHDAINNALSQIGVPRRPGKLDAFDVVNLGAYRSNEKIREEGTTV